MMVPVTQDIGISIGSVSEGCKRISSTSCRKTRGVRERDRTVLMQENEYMCILCEEGKDRKKMELPPDQNNRSSSSSSRMTTVCEGKKGMKDRKEAGDQFELTYYTI